MLYARMTCIFLPCFLFHRPLESQKSAAQSVRLIGTVFLFHPIIFHNRQVYKKTALLPLKNMILE